MMERNEILDRMSREQSEWFDGISVTLPSWATDAGLYLSVQGGEEGVISEVLVTYPDSEGWEGESEISEHDWQMWRDEVIRERKHREMGIDLDRNYAPSATYSAEDEEPKVCDASNRSDGSTASYYELPEGCTELQDLISYRNMNAQDGEIIRAIYRKGRASHSDTLRDAKKVLFYAKAEVERLEKYGKES